MEDVVGGGEGDDVRRAEFGWGEAEAIDFANGAADTDFIDEAGEVAGFLACFAGFGADGERGIEIW